MNKAAQLTKIPTGIAGLDIALEGGIPENRSMLVLGKSGTGKSFLLSEFIYRGITQHNQNGIIVSFEERTEDIINNVSSLGWNYQSLIDEKKLSIIDVSPLLGKQVHQTGDYDWMSGLLLRIKHRIKETDAKRISIDSIGMIISQNPQFENSHKIRAAVFSFIESLKKMGLTIVFSSEIVEGNAVRYGIEEFVADGVIELETLVGQNQIIRKLQIKKIRGTSYRSGKIIFELSDKGIIAYPKIPIDTTTAITSFDKRYKFGIAKLDEALNGGIPQGHMLLLGGNTGTGKTTLSLQFILDGLRNGENVLWVALEEPIQQIKKTAASHGWDLEEFEEKGQLAFVSLSLVDIVPDKLLYQIINESQSSKVTRVVFDSVSSLESATMDKNSVREFLIQLTGYFKTKGITCLMTYLSADAFGASSAQLIGSLSSNEMRLSSIIDAIIILRYVERKQSIAKLLNILKMRGTIHDKSIFQYEIEKSGFELGERFDK